MKSVRDDENEKAFRYINFTLSLRLLGITWHRAALPACRRPLCLPSGIRHPHGRHVFGTFRCGWRALQPLERRGRLFCLHRSAPEHGHETEPRQIPGPDL